MPFEWPLVRLGDHCSKIGSGATPKGGKESYLEDGPYRLIRSQNVYNAGFSWQGLAFISEEQARKLEGVSVEAGDVLVNITGDSVARVCTAPKAALPARVNQHVAIVRPHPDSLSSDYLRWFLCCPEQQELLLGLASAGATRNALTKGMLEAFRIPLPPLATQEELVAPLIAIEERIDLLRQTNTTLESIAQALFKSWFIDFDPVKAKAEGSEPEGMDAGTAALFPSEFEESALGLIPRGWRVVPFLHACDLLGGAQPPASTFVDDAREGYVRLLQIRDFSSDAHTTYVPDSKRLKRADEDDVLLGRYGSASGDKARDSLGRVCRGLSGAYNVALMKLSPIEVGREFALQLVNTPSFYNYLQGVSAKAVQSGFSKSELGNLSVVVPPRVLADVYEAMGLAMWQCVKSNRARAQSLTSLRNTLLPRLVSGKLRLPEAQEEIAAI